MSEDAYELDDNALVVKGGIVRDPQAVREKFEDAIADGYGPCHSVFVARSEGTDGGPMTLDEVCERSWIPNGKVQVTTVGKLRDAGFTFEHDPSDGQGELHHNVYLPEPVTESDICSFIDCFDEPVQNPHKARRR